jgi:hypothetical protein
MSFFKIIINYMLAENEIKNVNKLGLDLNENHINCDIDKIQNE